MKAFFVSIPHSGEQVPSETPWLHGLPEPLLMRDVDRFVDVLYAPVLQKLQIKNVKTDWHRYVVDLNRLPDDYDVDAVIGASHASGKFARGIHWVITTKGERLMPQPISKELHDKLIARYFEPFHVQVRKLFAEFKDKGAKTVFHLDAHSMPSVGTKEHLDPGQTRADIVVSDCKGVSCGTDFKDLVCKAYAEQGFSVAYNWPYVGGRVTETYGRPEIGQETIQVELSRSLYMNEESKRLLPEKTASIQARLGAAVEMILNSLPRR